MFLPRVSLSAPRFSALPSDQIHHHGSHSVRSWGLQEDLDEHGGAIWNHPHLPWCSAVGMVALRDGLDEANVFLDVPGHDLNTVARNLIEQMMDRGVATEDMCRNLYRVLHYHAGAERRRTTSGSSGGYSPGLSRRTPDSPGGSRKGAIETRGFLLYPVLRVLGAWWAISEGVGGVRPACGDSCVVRVVVRKRQCVSTTPPCPLACTYCNSGARYHRSSRQPIRQTRQPRASRGSTWNVPEGVADATHTSNGRVQRRG